jgi:hypothetical protein
VVVEYDGSAVVGTLLLDTWNGTEFDDNENITGGTSSFDATSDTATFYEEYTWEVDAKAEALTIVYDYLAAQMSEPQATLGAIYQDVIEWGGDEATASQLMFLGSGGWFTPRALQLWKGLLKSSITADFSDNFNRADEDLSVSANWDDVDNATNGLRVISNAVGGDNSAGTTNVGAVASAAHAFNNAQYVQATLTALPTAGDQIGVALRIDPTRNLCYAALVAEGTPDRYRIALVDFSTSAGTTTQLVPGPSTPAANDVLTLVAVGKLLIMFVNGVEECRVYDNESNRAPITSGQAGIFAEGDASPAGRLDDFSSGDFVDAVIHGEGVWIHDRGAGNIDFMTSDDGAQFTPSSTVTLTVQVDDEDDNPVQGARVRIANAPDSPGSTSIAEGTTNASGTFTAAVSYSGDVAVVTKVRLKGFKFFRTNGTIESTGLTVGVRFEANDIVDLP